MYVVEEIYTRPNSHVRFWMARSQYKEDVSAAATQVGDLIFQEIGVTQNPLVAKYRALWRSRAAYDKWVTDDPVTAQYNAMVAEYHAANGITAVRTY